jgi:hypothetical protein
MLKRSFATGLLVVAVIFVLTVQNRPTPPPPAPTSTSASPVFSVGGLSNSPLCAAMPHDVTEQAGFGSILNPGMQ